MTLVDTETGEAIVLLDKAEALKLTADIKAWAGTLWLKIEEAHRGQAWRALGYTSWAAYLETEFDISRSRGYRLVSHAKAVRELAEAAGIAAPEVSPMGDTPERVTRDIDVEAAAAEVAEKAADLPDDATDEDRAEIVKEVTRSHSERAKVTSPAPAAADPVADEAPEPEGEPAPAPPAGEPAKSVDDLYPDETYRINAGKAAVKVYEGLRMIDPFRQAEVEDADGRESMAGLAKTLRAKADEIDAALSASRALRRVK